MFIHSCRKRVLRAPVFAFYPNTEELVGFGLIQQQKKRYNMLM